MSQGSSDIRARAHGAMLGLAVGDALGWPIEDRGNRVGGIARLQPEFRFMGWRRREGGRYAPHEQIVRAGEYSDDTQLVLAVARSRSIGKCWWEYFTQVELPAWTTYERGGGGACKRAAQSWLRGQAPWGGDNDDAVRKYFQAGGAGAVMRCLPHCLASRPQAAEELNSALDLDGIATHGHPRALVGSRLYAAAIDWALYRDEPLSYGALVQLLLDASQWRARPTFPDYVRGSQFDGDAHVWNDEWDQAIEETTRLLHVSLDGLAQGAVAVDRPILEQLGAFGNWRGSGIVMAAAAIFLASRYASQPQQGLLAAAFARGSDTDTLASLTGALLGALHGSDWLQPLAYEVQDANYIAHATDQLLDQRPEVIANNAWRRNARTNLYRWLDGAKPDEKGTLGPFGEIRIIDVKDHESKSMFIRSWEMSTQVGQTIQVKRYEQGRDGKPRWRPLVLQTPKPESVPSPRAGVILQVSDLDVARRFYEQVVRLNVHRATEDYVSFGWLALEQTEEGQVSGQLEMKSSGPSQLIRVYMTEALLVQARDQVNAFGLPITDAPPRHKGHGFRCIDWDGHTVEFVAYNGRPSVI